MKMKLVLPVASMLFLAACSSSTREKLNPVVAAAPAVSPTLSQPIDKSLKRVVAIARFSNETNRGNAYLLDENSNRLGKQASDILSARMTDSGKFIMLERLDIDLIANESDLANKPLGVQPSDYLILGSISEYGRTNTSSVGVFSRNRIQQANVTVNIRLVNTSTGQIIYSQEATGQASSEASLVFGYGNTAGYDTDLDDRAISAAISKLVSNVSENLLDTPWNAYLLGESQGNLLLSGGQNQGISHGDSFQVMSKGQQVINPQSGQIITLEGQPVAKIKVVGFSGTGDNSVSLTQVTSGDIDTSALNNYLVTEL